MINLLILERKHALYSHDSKIPLGEIDYSDLIIPIYMVSMLHVFIIIDTKKNQYRIMKSQQFDESVKYDITKIDDIIDQLEQEI